MKITAVIDNYNSAIFVEEAIQSVLNQTRQPDELIIIDDGSTDKSVSIIEKAIQNISWATLICKPNGGQLSCLTEGILASSGDLIALLDGDDLWKANHLEEAVKAYEANPNLSLYYCEYQTFGGNYKGVARYPEGLLQSTFAVTALSESFFGNVTATLVFHRDALTPYLPFPKMLEKEWIINADNPLIWLSCFSGKHKFYNSNKNVKYRVHTNNMHKTSQKHSAKSRKRIATKRLFEYFRRLFYIPNDIHKCLVREYSAHPTKSKNLRKAYLKAAANSHATFLNKLLITIKLLIN